MDVVVWNTSRRPICAERSNLPWSTIYFIQTLILSANPHIAVAVFADLMNEASWDGVFANTGHIFFEIIELSCKVIDAAKEGTNPDTAFIVEAKRLYDIVSNWIWIVEFLGDVSEVFLVWIIDINSFLGADPVSAVILCDEGVDLNIFEIRFFVK